MGFEIFALCNIYIICFENFILWVLNYENNLLKNHFNTGLLEVQTHIVLTSNICDNIFFSLYCVFTFQIIGFSHLVFQKFHFLQSLCKTKPCNAQHEQIAHGIHTCFLFDILSMEYGITHSFA
jgi:hypothetical protein